MLHSDLPDIHIADNRFIVIIVMSCGSGAETRVGKFQTSWLDLESLICNRIRTPKTWQLQRKFKTIFNGGHRFNMCDGMPYWWLTYQQVHIYT